MAPLGRSPLRGDAWVLQGAPTLPQPCWARWYKGCLSHCSVVQTPAKESGPRCWKWESVWVCYVNWQSASRFTKTGSLVHTFASQTAILSSHPLGSRVFLWRCLFAQPSHPAAGVLQLSPGSLHPDMRGSSCWAVSGFGCTHSFQA